MIKVPVVFHQLPLAIGLLTWISLGQAIKLQPSKTSNTVFEHSNYAVLCESPNEVNIRWHKIQNGRRDPISTDRKNDHFVEESSGKSQLVFLNVTTKHAGLYECTDEKSTTSFELKVRKHLKLLKKPDLYYALLGNNVTLECGTESSENLAESWRFNENLVDFSSQHYTQLKNGLLVKNVTEKEIGNYTCTFFFTDDDVTDTESMKISLKQGKIPIIEEIYSKDTLHVLPSTVAYIRCKVSAEPSAKIQWFRNGAELDLRKSNASIENKDNESILKIFYSTNAYLGNYTCLVTNQFGKVNKSFNLVEGEQPDTPTLRVGKSTDRSCSLYIYPYPPRQPPLTIKAFYMNQNSSNSDWNVISFATNQPNPHSLGELNATSSYKIKVEVCTDFDICGFSAEESCETAAPTTGSANPIMINILTQFILLLPAFVIGFYSQ